MEVNRYFIFFFNNKKIKKKEMNKYFDLKNFFSPNKKLKN